MPGSSYLVTAVSTMYGPSYLSNQFLIAMPGLGDPNFYRTVTYVCQHDVDGALGIVINRPLALTLGELFEHIDISYAPDQSAAVAAASEAVFSGGPVQQEQGFVLHQRDGDWGATLAVTDDIALTTSRDVLQALADGRGPRRYLFALGYAGWGAGQLEQEMLDNAWLSGPADLDVLFDLPVEQRWQAAAELLGVDLRLLSGDAGHA